MDQQVITTSEPVRATNLEGVSCALAEQTNCACPKVECWKCNTITPICRNTCRIESEEYKGYIINQKELFTCERCNGYTLEEWEEWANATY